MSTQITENYTYINGYKISFREQGVGSPVILIPLRSITAGELGRWPEGAP